MSSGSTTSTPWAASSSSGREDRTHIKLYRARPYTCEVKDETGTRSLDAYDRGFKTKVSVSGPEPLELMLLRAPYPARGGAPGLEDRLRLLLTRAGSLESVASADAEPLAPEIALEAAGVNVRCTRAKALAPLPLESG